MPEEEKMLIRRVEDIAKLAEKYNTPRFSDFFDEHEQAVIGEGFFHSGLMWFGGNMRCARKMLGIFPDWCEPSEKEFPISALYIRKKGGRELSHRDYLGTVMGLGLERKKVGDIAVFPDGAYIFMHPASAEHAATQIDKVANCGVACKVLEASQAEIPEDRFEIMNIVAASMRLDAVISSLCNMSRRVASDYISSGRAAVCHKTTERCDFAIKDGDMLSLRGYGRFQIISAGGKTRSDRLHITVKKFI